jgi:hypothetical protein
MWRSSMRRVLQVFCFRRWWTPRDELYGIANQWINPGLGLHEPIGILELFTLNSKEIMCRLKLKFDFHRAMQILKIF